jgi:hypothetical protein
VQTQVVAKITDSIPRVLTMRMTSSWWRHVECLVARNIEQVIHIVDIVCNFNYQQV